MKNWLSPSALSQLNLGVVDEATSPFIGAQSSRTRSLVHYHQPQNLVWTGHLCCGGNDTQVRNKDPSMTEASHDFYRLRNFDPAQVALYNVGRLRTDIWHFLRDSARRLRRIQQDPRHADDKMWLTTACGEVFDFLRPLEDYFAFPGVTALQQLRANFDRGALRRPGASDAAPGADDEQWSRIGDSTWLRRGCKTMPIC